MNKLSTDLFYKTLEPNRGAGEKSPAVILLHGRGADENDLLGLHSTSMNGWPYSACAHRTRLSSAAIPISS